MGDDNIKLAVDGFGYFDDKRTGERKTVQRYTWTNRTTQDCVQVITYGATIVSMKTPDRNGVIGDVVCGFDDMEGYLDKRNPYFGATVGRVCNRIGFADFPLNGEKISVTKNFNNTHILHGGLVGFDKVNWTAYVDKNKVIMSYVSQDGEEGFPGAVLTSVTYELLSDSFFVKFTATSTKPTPINLTNHSYFNLAGHGAGYPELYRHVISINADKITETDEDSIPTGKLLDVGGTNFDLRIPKELGPMMAKQISTRGYDDNFCVTQGTEQKLTFVARVVHPETGRFLEVYSDQPGVQLYTSNFMPDPLNIIDPGNLNTQYFMGDTATGDKSDQPLIGKGGSKYFKHGAFCLETQKYPDSVNHSSFPSSILNPGETYNHDILFKFGIQK